MAPRLPIYLPTNYESSYSLLNAMSAEIGDAFREAGHPVNPPEKATSGKPGLLLWANFLNQRSPLWDTIASPASRVALVQFFVDHPLALTTWQIDRLSKAPRFRMALPCVDGAHLLRVRWPSLRHVHCLHGAPRLALCDLKTLEAEHLRDPADGGRAEQLVVLGSIHSREELDAKWAECPARVRKPAEDMVELLVAHPWMPFEQALDVVIASEGIIPGEWPFAAGLFRLVSATLNRRRRIRLVEAMQGIPTVVYGGPAWAEVCTGSLRYAGQVDYADVAKTMATAKVCLAWGPTQFTHSFSERLLLSMAAGCATVADDRLLVRKHFAAAGEQQCVSLFDAASPQEARARVEALLKDRHAALAMAIRGREAVERAHLWGHRLPTLLDAGAEALAA